MADRWSLREDYIVCKFAYEHVWENISIELFDCLMSQLDEAGFSLRSNTAVNKRVRDYQLLFNGCELSHVSQQVRLVYQSYLGKVNNPDLNKSIKSYIAETYDPCAPISGEPLSSKGFSVDEYTGNNNLSDYKYIMDLNLTFPMVLQKFIDQKGFKKHKEIYDKIYMKADTFSSILRGKYSVVKKENVLRLCIGLNLTLDEAEEFMESAGYLFSRAIITDVVIKAFLSNRCYDTFAIDNELYENKAPSLFGLA